MTSSFLALLTSEPIPPAIVFMLGALLVPFLKGPVRAIYMLALPVFSLVTVIGADHGAYWTYEAFGETLSFFRIDQTSLVFSYIFHLAAFLGVLYALHVKDRLQDTAGIIYAGSALGAVFAGDLVTFLIFWEVMAFSSVFMILARRTPESNKSAMRYLMVQLVSGLSVIVGIALHFHETGSLALATMTDQLMDGAPGALFIFLGFGLKCGWPLMHNWITDGYPAATPTGSVFLSAFTTKCAVYALFRCFPGAEPLVYIGTAMALFPIFYAVIENDLRRVLCYSMINQIGYMVVGIGIGTELALNGAAAHAFCDILFKGLLFMSMGAVLLRTGIMNGSHLGGLHRTMPWTAGFCAIGAASISAFPLFSGFISKSMIMTAAAAEGRTAVWFCLLFGAAGVFHHAGIKIPFFAFFGHDRGMRPKEAPKNMLAAMAIAAGCCIALGSFPDQTLYNWLPFPVDYEPYTTMHVITQTQLLFFSALAFCVLMITGLYPPELVSVNLDADWWYRKGSRRFLRFVEGPLMAVFGGLSRIVHEVIPDRLSTFAKNPAGSMKLAYDRARLGFAGAFAPLPVVERMRADLEADQGRYERTRPGSVWPIGTTVLYMALLFLIFLIVYLTSD